MWERLGPRRSKRQGLVGTHPWEDVLASFTDAVVVCDEAGQIVLFNHAAEELTGVPRRRAFGQPCARVFDRTPIIPEMVRRVRETGQNESRGDEHLSNAERTIPARISCLAVWDSGNQIRGTALVVQDLTYQKTLEESARRNESLARLGTLVAGLAHEIRNPLAGIKGAAQLLGHRLQPADGLHEFVQVITREVDRLSELLEDLLVLGASPKPRMATFNIHQVLRRVNSVIEPELARHGFRLRCEFDPSLPDVRGDEAQLSQVFLNLLKNAMDAMMVDGPPPPSRRTIVIRTRIETDFHILRDRARSSRLLRVEVADEGIGIDPADAARAFEPFFTTKPRGTGLGLAICHRIVAEHGGIIRLQRNRPAGTVVTVTLPMAAE